MQLSIKTTSAYYVNNLLSILEEDGVNISILLTQCRIRPRALQNDSSLIPFEKYFKLIELASNTTTIPALGIKAGINVPIAPHDSLSFAGLISPTLEELLRRFCRLGPKPKPLLQSGFYVNGSKAILEIKVHDDPRVNGIVRRYLVLELAGIFTRLSDLLGLDDCWLEYVEFPFDAENEEQAATRLLSCPIRWNCDSLKLVFPRELMSYPISPKASLIDEACQQQHEYLERQYKSMVDELRQGHTLTVEINRLITLRPSNLPGIDEISELLDISKRTLQRQLKTEGTSYRQLILNFKMVFAKFYLEQTLLPAAEIGFLVGYNEHVNFYRAFKGFYGVRPGQMRKHSN